MLNTASSTFSVTILVRNTASGADAFASPSTTGEIGITASISAALTAMMILLAGPAAATST